MTLLTFEDMVVIERNAVTGVGGGDASTHRHGIGYHLLQTRGAGQNGLQIRRRTEPTGVVDNVTHGVMLSVLIMIRRGHTLGERPAALPPGPAPVR